MRPPEIESRAGRWQRPMLPLHHRRLVFSTFGSQFKKTSFYGSKATTTTVLQQSSGVDGNVPAAAARRWY